MRTITAVLAACLLSSCMMPLLPVASRNPAADMAVPVHFRSAAPHVTGRINGRSSISLLLDTGAVMSVFEPDVATYAGLMPSGERAVKIRGVHGTAAATRAVMNTLEIGSWRGTNVPCLVRGSPSFRPGGLGNAILGMDHFRRHCSFMTVDYRRGGVELGFSRSFQPGGSRVTRTPLRWVNGLPVIRVSSGGLSWDAVVDTGSSWGIVVDQSTAARLGHARGGYSMGDKLILTGVGGSVRADQAGARVVRVSGVSLCGENHSGAAFYVMPGPKRIGSRFWAGSRLTLDFRTNTLWLER
jgi:predicted aspartyl protease